MKALLYVRVSSKEQEKEGYSLDAQEKLGEDYARRNNLAILKRWKVSESAWKEEREAFNAMIDYSKKHENIKHIIFDVTDRMTRNDMDKIKICTLVKYHDKTIHFSRSNKKIDKNSGSEDLFMLDIEVAVAKKMSNDISRKTKMGMLEKAEQGLFPSNAPLGYKNNPLTHLLDIDEVKAPYIQRAFSLIGTGSYSIDMVREVLYREGFRGKLDNKVGKSAIDHILKNPIYYGAFRWNDKMYQGSHAPLISKDLFDTVQAVLSGKYRPYKHKHNFAFNNLLRCGICDCSVLGELRKGRYTYYHCSFSKGRHKGIEYVRQELLAEMFKPSLQAITINNDLGEWLKEAIRNRLQDSQKLQENRFKALQAQQEKVKARLSRLYDAKFDNTLNEEVFETKEAEYKNQLIEIKSKIDNSKDINPDACRYADWTLELSKRLIPLYEKANPEEKAKILKTVASNYTLHYKSIIPQYKKPFSFIAKGLLCTSWLPG